MMNSLQDPLKRLRAPPPLRPPLRPPDVTHVMNRTRPSAFFAALLHPCNLLSTETEEQKKRDRPGNEATANVHFNTVGCSFSYGLLLLIKQNLLATSFPDQSNLTPRPIQPYSQANPTSLPGQSNPTPRPFRPHSQANPTSLPDQSNLTPRPIQPHSRPIQPYSQANPTSLPDQSNFTPRPIQPHSQTISTSSFCITCHAWFSISIGLGTRLVPPPTPPGQP